MQFVLAAVGIFVLVVVVLLIALAIIAIVEDSRKYGAKKALLGFSKKEMSQVLASKPLRD